MQFAVKQLTMSDLTFFEVQFRRFQQEAKAQSKKGSKQKAINLNADVFVDIAFPAARGDTPGQRFSLPLTIYGPGHRTQAQLVTRKVIPASGGGKNWRLNGELVPSPEFDPHRYDALEPGDLAVLGLEGDVAPTEIIMVLVSQREPNDQNLFQALNGLLGNRSMTMLTPSQMATAVDLTSTEHSVRELFDTELDLALVEAALGSPRATQRLRQRASSRRTSHEAIRAARLEAEATGLRGEALLNSWLRLQQSASKISSFKWASEEMPLNPWDFEVMAEDGTCFRVELKTTKGKFNTPFHLSQGEIECAADPTAPRTDLYRVFEITNDVGMLAVAEDIRPLASDILQRVSSLGPGITPESYLVDVGRLTNWRHLGPISLRGDQDEDADPAS